MKKKDDDKFSGKPMFPRLHVKDTEKGGPRAPPRNKMALYEQLSIPSQRFNHGVLPLNPNSNGNMVPPAGQGSGLERSMFLSRHLPSSTATPTRTDEEPRPHRSNDWNLNTPLVQLEQGNKVGEENDFQVPVFVNSMDGEGERNTPDGRYREKLTPFTPSYLVCSTKVQSTLGRNAKQISSQGHNLRQVAKEQSREKSTNSDRCVLNMDHSAKSPRRKMNELSKAANSFSDVEHQDHLVGNLSSLHETDASYQHECSSRQQSEDNGHINGGVDERTRYIQNGSTCGTSNDSHLGGVNCSEPHGDNEHPGNQMCGSRPTINVEKSGDVSETSMVDSISALDISPDDVVGIIGQKRFWKARRAIVNQQRVFAVQVFELHKLIKVQKLFAGSPHLVHEDSAYLGKPSLKGSPVKKFPEYVVRPTPFIVKRKDESEKVVNKMEHSAENAVVNANICAKSDTHPSSHGPYLGNLPPRPVATDNMGPLGFQPTPGHQWLVPVMTPSEGLVYKPYPGSGFMGAGCGPFGPTSFKGNFMTPGYGVPAYNHQGVGLIPSAPPIGHGFFSPYAMPFMNTAFPGSAAEQMNHFAGPVPISHGYISDGGANISMQHQSSCSVPTQKSGATTHVAEVWGTKNSELQRNIASCPSERAQGTETGLTSEGRDSRRVSQVAPAVQTPQAVSQSHDNGEQSARVIRVVPHNPISATESAARIFQSIQKERKHHDFM